jgi:hypothetical protein
MHRRVIQQALDELNNTRRFGDLEYESLAV